MDGIKIKSHELQTREAVSDSHTIIHSFGVKWHLYSDQTAALFDKKKQRYDGNHLWVMQIEICY